MLHADVTCKGNGVIVGANDVTIDLNGHTLAGNKTGIGISMTTFPGTQVRNGTIKGFATAISNLNAPQSRLNDVDMINNRRHAGCRERCCFD